MVGGKGGAAGNLNFGGGVPVIISPAGGVVMMVVVVVVAAFSPLSFVVHVEDDTNAFESIYPNL